MKRKNVTRNALFTSVISLLLCVSMLVGTTFAWFTDSVESQVNTIAAGNLDIELYHTNKTDKGEQVTETVPLFDDVTLWEPGAALYETLKVVNEGTLALKYNLNLNVLEETVTEDGDKLSDVIMVGKLDGALGDGTTREGLIAAVTEWTPLNAFSMKENAVELEVGGNDEFTVVLYWKPNTSDIDNRYNVANKDLKVKVGVVLTATQVEAESDSFGDDYDSAAKVPGATTSTTRTPVNSDGSVSLTVINAPAADTKRTTVDAPAGAFTAGDEVEIEVTTVNTLFNVTADGGSVAALDVTLKVNGEEKEEALEDGAVYTVTTYVSKNLTNVEVKYTGTDGKAQPTLVSYDAETGKLVFTTNHFSNYAVYGAALAYDAKNDTAVNDVETIVDAAKDSNTSVIIPDANKEAVSEEIDKAVENGIISEADKNVIDNALMYVAKIGEKNFTTVAAAFADAADGAIITLLKDVQIDADNTITVKETATLDLNGKTLSGVSDQTGANRNMFDANGGTLTVKNGTITVKHTGANMGWNNSTNVFNVTAGGVLNIENATIENLGGSDMAFCVHLNNWGEVTLNAENTTFKSSYIAVRAFNSGNDMNNITIKNSTLSGKYAFWVHNYTVADFGTEEKAAAHAALLNFDIFNGTNSFISSSKPETPVLYGFTDAVYFTAEGARVVSTMTELQAAVKAGAKVIDAKGANLGDFNYDVVFEDGTVLKNAKLSYMYGGGANGTVTFENCEFVSDHSYSCHFDNGGGKLVFNNCLFDGWNSFGDAITNVEMNGCTFQKTYNYGILRFYQTAQLKNCIFADSFEGVDTNVSGQKVEFTDCTGIDGKIFNNGSNTGVWVVDGTDISNTVTSW